MISKHLSKALNEAGFWGKSHINIMPAPLFEPETNELLERLPSHVMISKTSGGTYIVHGEAIKNLLEGKVIEDVLAEAWIIINNK